MFVKAITIVGLVLSIAHAVAPDLLPTGFALGAIVLLGLIYGGVAINSENARDYLILVVTVSMASMGDVLSHIPFIGVYMDAVLDNVMTGLQASTVVVLTDRTSRLVRKRRKRASPA